MRRFLVCFLLLSGCAVPSRLGEQKAVVPVAVVPAHPWREMIVYVPQTDDAAASWLKWFVKYPNLRMVIAMSPHFQHLAKDPALESAVSSASKSGTAGIGVADSQRADPSFTCGLLFRQKRVASGDRIAESPLCLFR